MDGPLRLVALGASGSYPGPGQACSGYLFTSKHARVWVDAGSGTLANLQLHVGVADLDAVLISHEHGDHWLDLAPFTNALFYYQPRDRLIVCSNQATRAKIESLIEPDKLDAVYDWRIVEPGAEITVGDQRWRFAATDHYVETLAMQVTVDDTSVIYSADTGPDWDLGAFEASPAVCLIESTFLRRDGNEGLLHLAAAEAGAVAQTLESRSLILTHLAPGQDPDAHREEAATVFDGPIAVAETSRAWDVGPDGFSASEVSRG